MTTHSLRRYPHRTSGDPRSWACGDRNFKIQGSLRVMTDQRFCRSWLHTGYGTDMLLPLLSVEFRDHHATDRATVDTPCINTVTIGMERGT
jgi:hypothetical protein